MFNVGTAELVVILTIGLIVLGPTKLPQVARQVGKVVSEMRQMAAGFKAEMDSALQDTTPTSPQAPAPLAPAPPQRALDEPAEAGARAGAGGADDIDIPELVDPAEGADPADPDAV